MLGFLESIFILILYIFDTYIVLKYMNAFFCEYDYSKRFLRLAVVLKIVLAYITTFYFPYALVNMTVAFLVIFFVAACYRASIVKKLICTFCVLALKIFAEMIAFLIVVRIDVLVINKKAYNDDYVGLFLALIIYLAMAFVVERFRHLNSKMKVSKPFLIVFIAVPIITIAFEIIFLQQKNFSKVVFILSLIFSLTVFFLMLFLYDLLGVAFQEKTKSGILMAEKEYYVKHAEKIQDNERELRKFRHDITNKLSVASELIMRGENNRALNYISGLISRINDIKVYSQTGNIVIDSIINYKLSQAADNGINIIYDIQIASDMAIEDDDMVVILGNLLDNAIEAAAKTDSDKYINLFFKDEKSYIYIDIKNSYNGEINIEGYKIKTTKQDEELHGIGLESVKDVIKKYSGNIDYEYDDKEFHVMVMLYVK